MSGFPQAGGGGLSTASITVFNPADPAAGATGAPGAMMGYGTTVSFTPSVTGNLVVNWTGDLTNNTAADTTQVLLYFGTGAAPANGTAGAVGTKIGPTNGVAGIALGPVGASISAKVTGLVKGTAYWFDLLLLTVPGGTGTVKNSSFTIQEVT